MWGLQRGQDRALSKECDSCIFLGYISSLVDSSVSECAHYGFLFAVFSMIK